MITRDAIFAAKDLPLEPVEVPEWGGTVYVRTMSGVERDNFDTKVMRRSRNGADFDIKGLRVQVVILTACNEEGELLFSDKDNEELSKKNSLVLDRICNAARRVNGILGGDEEALEDSKKN